MNGYFQLVCHETETAICLYPATDGGTPLDINEVTNYLTMKNITYDSVSLYKEAVNLKEKKKIVLNKDKSLPEREMFVLSVSQDKMSAVARFYPPSEGGELLSAEEIFNDLTHRKIVSGIKKERIEQFLKEREYCKDYVLAEGKEPIQGTDATIEYYFNTDPKARPTLNEDGSVDFFHLNALNHCKEGDVLARLFRETQGEDGENVFGERIKPREVKKQNLQFGRDITLSEDRTVITSNVNGHVSFVDGKVFVSDVYMVENVDNSTGNIEYEGSVQVNGNVRSGFAIKASGNVEVRGVVEGATIEAGGNIVIARGMNGMSKGVIKADGNIISKFLENATAIAGGFVESDSVLHSNIMAGTEINVTSKRGFITGGRVCATHAVNVKHLGSAMGTDTIVEVGVDPEKKQRYADLQKSIVTIKKELDTMLPVLQANKEKIARGARFLPEQIAGFKQLVEVAKAKQEQFLKEMAECEELKIMLEGTQDATVKVFGDVYAGTRIAISDVSLYVNETVSYCRFVKSQGDVKMTSL